MSLQDLYISVISQVLLTRFWLNLFNPIFGVLIFLDKFSFDQTSIDPNILNCNTALFSQILINSRQIISNFRINVVYLKVIKNLCRKNQHFALSKKRQNDSRRGNFMKCFKYLMYACTVARTVVIVTTKDEGQGFLILINAILTELLVSLFCHSSTIMRIISVFQTSSPYILAKTAAMRDQRLHFGRARGYTHIL